VEFNRVDGSLQEKPWSIYALKYFPSIENFLGVARVKWVLVAIYEQRADKQSND
jgi:hypothetical protein